MCDRGPLPVRLAQAAEERWDMTVMTIPDSICYPAGSQLQVPLQRRWQPGVPGECALPVRAVNRGGRDGGGHRDAFAFATFVYKLAVRQAAGGGQAGPGDPGPVGEPIRLWHRDQPVEEKTSRSAVYPGKNVVSVSMSR